MDSRQGVAAGPGITLAPLEPDDREQFTADNQEAFLHGATKEFGMRDDHFEEDGQIISRETIERAIDEEHAEAWRIVMGDRAVGGIVLNIDRTRGGANWSCCSSHRMPTAGASGRRHGARWSACTPRCARGAW